MPTVSIHEHAAVATQWQFISQTRSGTSYLHILDLLQDDTGSTVLEKLRKEYYRIKAQPPYNTWDKISFFWKPVLSVATISEVNVPLTLSTYFQRKIYSYHPKNSTTDLESQNGPRCVLVSSRERDPEFTAAFRNPEILSAADGFVKRNARFAVHPPSSGLQEGRQAIMIKQELNRLGIWVLNFAVTVICISVGVVVGILTKSVDLGVAITSGIATIAACSTGIWFSSIDL
jgi:hypothetical protein